MLQFLFSDSAEFWATVIILAATLSTFLFLQRRHHKVNLSPDEPTIKLILAPIRYAPGWYAAELHIENTLACAITILRAKTASPRSARIAPYDQYSRQDANGVFNPEPLLLRDVVPYQRAVAIGETFTPKGSPNHQGVVSFLVFQAPSYQIPTPLSISISLSRHDAAKRKLLKVISTKLAPDIVSVGEPSNKRNLLDLIPGK